MLRLDEVLESARLRARDMFPGFALPIGETIANAVGLGMPTQLADGPLKFEQAAPKLGQHNAAVYLDSAGLNKAALEGLR